VIECEARTGKYGVGLDKDYFADRVRGSLAAEGKSISAQALDALYSRAGTELRTLNEELRKLISFVGDRAAITPADVSQVCDDLHKAAFYELTQSLRTRDFQKCVVALHENMKITAHPLQTLAMIISEVRKLMIARELLFTVFRSDWRSNITFRDFQGVYKTVQSSEAGKTSLKALTSKDYALYMLLKDAQRFTLAELGQFMEWALEADIKLKSTKLAAKAPYLILEELVLKMTLGPKAGVQS
jgi:DNA polymerase-3 subunit delta